MNKKVTLNGEDILDWIFEHDDILTEDFIRYFGLEDLVQENTLIYLDVSEVKNFPFIRE